MENTEAKNPKQWRLKQISIELQKYGEFKGKYLGKITFDNEDSESFTFNIQNDMAERYLKVMANDLVAAASQLSTDLLDTLPI